MVVILWLLALLACHHATQGAETPGLRSRSRALQAQGTCVPAISTTGYLVDNDGSGSLSPGDCVAYNQTVASVINFSGSSAASFGLLPGGGGLYGSFQLNQTCGPFGGINILSAEPASTYSSTSASSGTITMPSCPAGQAALAPAPAPAPQPAGSPTPAAMVTPAAIPLGAGTVPSYCGSGQLDAGICYPACASGYTGQGPLCYVNCQAPFSNGDLTCGLPPAIYQTGVSQQDHCQEVYKDGFPVPQCNMQCPLTNPNECSSFCYAENCPAGTNPLSGGCPSTCVYNCPAGTTGNGGSACTKVGVPRGSPTIPSCAPGQQLNGGLCYPSCNGDTVGPLCYPTCPAAQPYRLGVSCYANQADADAIISSIVIGAVALAALTVLTGGLDLVVLGPEIGAGGAAAAGDAAAAPLLVDGSAAATEAWGITASQLAIEYTGELQDITFLLD
jgi:hypothetical protein